MKWPNPEDELLATCARLEFSEADRGKVTELCRRNEIRWGRMYTTSRMHGVAPLVYRNLSQIDRADLRLENGSLERFRRSLAKNVAAKSSLKDGLWQILGFFNERGVDVMLIKGTSMNLLGAGSGPYTVSRDIDLIIRARPEELPSELVAELAALSDGFPLEYDFYGHHDVDMNGVLPIDWPRVWADAISVHYERRDFFIMSPEDTLITACINACRKRYFNLKALCAIDVRLRDGAALRWDDLAEKSRAYEVKDIVYAALLVAAQVMSSPVPADLAERLAPSRAALLQLLSKRLSFSSLSSLYEGADILSRKVGASLLLPYASYRSDQVLRKFLHAVST